MRLLVWRSVAYLLTFFLAIPPSMYGQQAPPSPAENQPMAPLPTIQNLKVISLAGEGDMNDLERHVMAPLVVQVLDQNDRPVEGAEVVFRFPLTGASAAFADKKLSRLTRTNSQGQAAATGWAANGQVGTFQVHVTASYGNQMGEKTISMTNVTRIVEDMKKQDKKWWSTRKFKIGLIAGGAAAAAIIAIVLTTGGGSSGSAPVTITPGAPTVGGPQ